MSKVISIYSHEDFEGDDLSDSDYELLKDIWIDTIEEQEVQ